ncbi:hypothetical protein [Bosea sp. (in: a-proteobacteria)]|uniref:hypothetical protein n=1 Tax=Bosea sp. (in: a-proteobacteria) TaxID=1871050 RepID=UPI003B3B0941
MTDSDISIFRILMKYGNSQAMSRPSIGRDIRAGSERPVRIERPPPPPPGRAFRVAVSQRPDVTFLGDERGIIALFKLCTCLWTLALPRGKAITACRSPSPRLGELDIEHKENIRYSVLTLSGIAIMAENKKQTSSGLAARAAATLSDPNASAIARSLAGSALSQSGTGRQTGSEMEDKASRVLTSSKYSEETKALAGSVLAQSNKKR